MTREPTTWDARVLFYMLDHTSDPDMRDLLLEDIKWVADQLDPPIREQVVAQAGLRALPSYFGADTDSVEFELDVSPKKPQEIDVLIVTVKPPELDAAKVAFGVDLRTRPDDVPEGFPLWRARVRAGRSEDDVSVAITTVGEDSNYEMAAFCGALYSLVRPRVCVLIGMAAGRRPKMHVGDTAAASEVVDYVRGARRPDGVVPDPRAYPAPRAIFRQLRNFDPRRHGWHSVVRDRLREVEAMEMEGKPEFPARFAVDTFQPTYAVGPILAGDYLIEDDSLDSEAEKLHKRRALAGEMEGVGFAAAAQAAGIPWIVMRGIADYGGRRRTKRWQFVSTLGAATAFRLLLEYDLVVQGGREF